MSLTLCPKVITCDTDDALVLLDQRSSRYWQLNATGAVVLRALLAGATPDQVAHRLAATQPVSPDQAAADVEAFVDQLTQAGLARRRSRAKGTTKEVLS